MTEEEEIKGIEVALDVLLREILTHDQRRPRGPFKRQTFAEIVSLPVSGSQVRAEEIIDDPIGAALRHGVRAMGKRLYELGSLRLMEDVCERVAAMDQSKLSWRADIMDKRWDGIGAGDGPGWFA